ncbi:MAG: response regulator [Vicinamibacterales bacterium]|nr:response regulator [Vicinamibacterales bacterium]
MKALVVDDSRAMRMLLSTMLREFGFDVAQACHGREALAHLMAHPDVDLALIDWNMPEMNGLELVEAVRAGAHWPSLRMMMVTTETEMDQMTRALMAGAHEYVMKPFTRAVIEQKLRVLGLAA